MLHAVVVDSVIEKPHHPLPPHPLPNSRLKRTHPLRRASPPKKRPFLLSELWIRVRLIRSVHRPFPPYIVPSARVAYIAITRRFALAKHRNEVVRPLERGGAHVQAV